MNLATRFGPYVLLAATCAALFFWGLGATPLVGLDEGLYAEASREMLTSGNYVVPTHDGRPFFEKPPLCYWLQAAAMREFGATSFAARLPSAIAGVALVALTTWLGSVLFSRRAGILAGFTLACNPLTVGTSRLAVMDQVFALAITASLGALAVCMVGGRRLTVGGLIFWGAMGVSLLVKGPAGAVLVLLTVGAFMAIRRDAGPPRKAVPLAGLPLAAAVALPWYVLIQKETGGAFLREFIVHQNLQRAAGLDFSHNMPFWFYLPIYLVGFFPWSLWVPLAWKMQVRMRPKTREEAAALFAGVWIAVTVVLFSLFRSKLPAYVYPAWPPSAMLVGLLWDNAGELKQGKAFAWCAGAALVVAAGIGAAMMAGQAHFGVAMPGLRVAVTLMSGALCVGPAVALLMLMRQRAMGAFACLCAAMVALLLVAALMGLPIAARSLSEPMVGIARDIAEHARANERAYTYDLSPPQPAIPFYARHFVPKLDNLDAVTSDGSALVVLQEDRMPVLKRLEVVTRRRPYVLCRFTARSHQSP